MPDVVHVKLYPSHLPVNGEFSKVFLVSRILSDILISIRSLEVPFERIRIPPKKKSPPQKPWYELQFYRWRQYKGQSNNHERDYQRSKCYASEASIVGRIPNNPRYETVPEIEAYLDKVMSRAWFKKRWELRTRPRILAGQAHRKAVSYGGCIALPKWARSRLIILHELAHEVDCRYTGYGHGRYWARSFLEMVKFEMGPEAYKILKDSFREHGVKFSPRKRSNMTHEQRQAARERFIKNIVSKRKK